MSVRSGHRDDEEEKAVFLRAVLLLPAGNLGAQAVSSGSER
jgi:hypothetical protein